MIVLQLQSNPARRPSVDKLLQHEFFAAGIMPAALPVSCLTTAPRTDQLEGVALHRRPLNEVNSNGKCTILMYICTYSYYPLRVSIGVGRMLVYVFDHQSLYHSVACTKGCLEDIAGIGDMIALR